MFFVSRICDHHYSVFSDLFEIELRHSFELDLVSISYKSTMNWYFVDIQVIRQVHKRTGSNWIKLRKQKRVSKEAPDLTMSSGPFLC